MAELQIMEQVGHGLQGTMRNMNVGDFVVVDPARRSTAARSAWELKLNEGKEYTVRLTEDRMIRVTRIK